MISDSYCIIDTQINIIANFMRLCRTMDPSKEYLGCTKQHIEVWIHFYMDRPYSSLNMIEKVTLANRMKMANEIWKKVTQK